MENLIKKVYEEKLNDGSIEKIISERIDELVRRSCEDLFQYNGPIRKKMEEQLNKVMEGMLKKTNFYDFLPQFQTVINNAMPLSCADTYKKCIDSVLELIGTKPKIGEKICLEDIFDKYIEWIEKSTIDFDYCDYDCVDDGRILINCKCSIEKKFDSYYITMSIEDDSIKDVYFKENHLIKFQLDIGLDGTNTIISEDYNLSDIRYLSSFEIYLCKLANSYTKCLISSENDLENTANCEVEY